MMMKLFEKQKLKNLNNENEIHHFIESLKLTFADREMYFTGQKNLRLPLNTYSTVNT